MSQFETGTILEGRYRILKEIGKGGNSVVYLVEDVHLEKQWAMKRILVGEEREEEYRQEVNLLKELRHEGIPMLADSFRIKQYFCLVMEYVEGISLQEYVDRHGFLSEEKAVIWMEELAGILEYLHSRRPSILYLDMKPENIILMPNGHLKLVDFGAAMLSIHWGKAGASEVRKRIYGTFGYAAPEQLVRGLKASLMDEQSDIYGLGMTMYYLLTGIAPNKPPYEIREICESNPEISKALEQIVKKAMQKEKKKRYHTISEVSRDLKDRQRKRHIDKVWNILWKLGNMGLLLASAVYLGIGVEGIFIEKWYDYKRQLFMGILLSGILFGIQFPFSRKKKKRNYMPKCNLLLTEKTEIGLWGMVLLLMVGGSFWQVKQKESVLFRAVQIEDNRNRNILIKENGVYYTKEPIFFVVNKAGVEKKETTELWQVRINHGEWREVTAYRFQMNIEKLKQEQKEIEIDFRRRRIAEKEVAMKSFKIGYEQRKTPMPVF